MQKVTCQVKDIHSGARQALEDLLGQTLRDNQQLIIQVLNHADQGPAETAPTSRNSALLPEWCNVYEGLSNDEINDLEQTILSRVDLSRNDGKTRIDADRC